MTQLRRTACPDCGYDLDPISNYFDRVLGGIAPRGGSFTDIDACVHDGPNGRWLIMEFKGPTGALNEGQKRNLKALARQRCMTVWCLRRRGDGKLDYWDVRKTGAVVITEAELRDKYAYWWAHPNA